MNFRFDSTENLFAVGLVVFFFALHFLRDATKRMRAGMPRLHGPRRAPEVQLSLALNQGEERLVERVVHSLRAQPNVHRVDVEFDRFRGQHTIEVTYRGELDLRAAMALTNMRDIRREVEEVARLMELGMMTPTMAELGVDMHKEMERLLKKKEAEEPKPTLKSRFDLMGEEL